MSYLGGYGGGRWVKRSAIGLWGGTIPICACEGDAVNVLTRKQTKSENVRSEDSGHGVGGRGYVEKINLDERVVRE